MCDNNYASICLWGLWIYLRSVVTIASFITTPLSLSLCTTVCDDHLFKDEKLFYRFRKDDGSYQEPTDAAILAKGQRLYSR